MNANHPMSSRSSWAILFALVAIVIWRAAWLASGVPDDTTQADAFRSAALEQSETYLVSWSEQEIDSGDWFELDRTGMQVWDAEAPVWITPGVDQKPGWGGWDDNRDGETDDPGELGAAWSDDFCVVQSQGETPPSGRVIDRGAYVATDDSSPKYQAVSRVLFRVQPK